MKSPEWSRVGDFAHMLIITNAVIFAYTVVFYYDSKIFDPVWQPNGFCVSNEDVPYWTSHDMCLYYDTIATIIMSLVYMVLKETPGLEQANQFVKTMIPGTLFHGVAHGLLAKAMRDDVTREDPAAPQFGLEVLSELSILQIISNLLLIGLFWIFLYKAAMPKVTMHVIIPMTAVTMLVEIHTPRRLGFTYVQTLLTLASSLNHLFTPSNEKGLIYALYPLCLGPTSFIAWVESMLCSKGIIDIGGHLIYDAFIPIGTISFYLTAWVMTKAKAKEKAI